MKKIIALLLLVFSAVSLQAQHKVATKKKVAFYTYTDDKEKVFIKYPTTWVHKPYPTSVFMFMRPIEEKGQKFRENINLVVGDAERLDVNEYLIDARKKMKESMVGFQELQSEYIKINGLDFARVVYQFNDSHLVIKSVFYLTVYNGKAYSLNCTALDTTFERFYPLFQQMAESFKIL